MRKLRRFVGKEVSFQHETKPQGGAGWWERKIKLCNLNNFLRSALDVETRVRQVDASRPRYEHAFEAGRFWPKLGQKYRAELPQMERDKLVAEWCRLVGKPSSCPAKLFHRKMSSTIAALKNMCAWSVL